MIAVLTLLPYAQPLILYHLPVMREVEVAHHLEGEVEAEVEEELEEEAGGGGDPQGAEVPC